MQSNPAELFLSAYDENEVTLRLDFVTEAFWDDTENIDDIIERIRTACTLIGQANMPSIIPIIHCRKFLVCIETFLMEHEGEEMPFEYFVSEVLRVTGWVPVDKCADFTTMYCGESSVESPIPQCEESAPNQLANSTDDDFGFTITYEAKQYEPPLFLLYARAAIDGMLALHKERYEKNTI